MRGRLLVVLWVVPAVCVGQQPERNAEEVYQNVQVLRGVRASTFMNTMFFQRYALGVSCSYCHVGTEWHKDDKPEKVKAREMMRMVESINATHFGGKPVVNCVSCHNGAVKPALDIQSRRVPIQNMIGPRPAPGGQKPMTTKSVEEVIAKYIGALGTADALAKVKSRVVKGNMITSDGGIVPFEDSYLRDPASTLSVRHFGSSLGDFVTGYDGEAGWNSDNRGLTPQRGEALAQLRMNAMFEDRANIRTVYSGLVVTGMDSVGSTPTYVITGTSTVTGRVERLYFDAQSGLLLRRSVETRSVFGAIVNDTYYENYRVVDGIMIPTMVSEFTPDFGTIKKATSVEHNVPLERTKFAMPNAR